LADGASQQQPRLHSDDDDCGDSLSCQQQKPAVAASDLLPSCQQQKPAATAACDLLPSCQRLNGSCRSEEEDMTGRLPDEMWVTVFSYLSQPELCSLATVSRRFYRLAMDPSLWREGGRCRKFVLLKGQSHEIFDPWFFFVKRYPWVL
jgi:hypothetical protein